MERKIIGSLEFDGGDINCKQFAKSMNDFVNNPEHQNGKIEASKTFDNVIDFECNLAMAENILDYIALNTELVAKLKILITKEVE